MFLPVIAVEGSGASFLITLIHHCTEAVVSVKKAVDTPDPSPPRDQEAILQAEASVMVTWETSDQRRMGLSNYVCK